MTTHEDAIISVTPFRRLARRSERRYQQVLDKYKQHGGVSLSEAERRIVDRVPGWAHGVKVVPAGRAMWAVVATENEGH